MNERVDFIRNHVFSHSQSERIPDEMEAGCSDIRDYKEVRWLR